LKINTSQLIKYFLIGCTASAVDVTVFFLMSSVLHFGILFANAISILSSGTFSFILNAIFNFYKTDNLIYRGVKFSIVIFIGYLASSAIIYGLYLLLNLNETISKVITLPIVFVLQYHLNSKYSFK